MSAPTVTITPRNAVLRALAAAMATSALVGGYAHLRLAGAVWRRR